MTISPHQSGIAMDLFPEVVPRIDGDMANDRYTTKPTLDWCKRVLNVDAFDLDVAACREAHHARRWFHAPGAFHDSTIGAEGSNGLELLWNADRIWCNPPYDDLDPWVCKAWETMFAAATTQARFPTIGMLIPDNRREQPFWQRLIEPFRDGRWERIKRPNVFQTDVGRIWVAHDHDVRLFTHSLPGRQPFGVPGNPEGIGQQSPPFGVVLLEWRFA